MQVSFVIPVFNQLTFTRECREALDKHAGPASSFEAIWVNDGSDQSTCEYLDSLPAPHRVIHLKKNQGFARATNRGAMTATADWICLLNNDVALRSGTIPAMIKVGDKHRDAGIIGNVQVLPQGETLDHTGIKFADGGYPVHRRDSLDELQQRGPAIEVVAVTAACCLVRRDWFNAMGGLDDRYTNGFEDVDLCMRAREAGWKIYLATQSIATHAVSTSEGRGRFEYRNAKKFLDRWGPRTAAIERAEIRAEAQRYQLSRATATTAAAPAVKRVHDQVRRDHQTRETNMSRAAVVWVDLMRMEPQGANGGIKPLVYGFLRELTRLKWQPLQFVLLVQESLVAEISFLRPADVLAVKASSGWRVTTVGTEAAEMTAAAFESAYPPEVLYSPFGVSAFARSDLPQVALLVDCLHRDLPSALPVEEVNFREESFKRVIGSSAWIQTLAQHGMDRLQAHWRVPPTRCFHTYASVQGRLNFSITPDQRPASLPANPFFFYPANFWPHKNHEVLLTAYHKYKYEKGDDAWDLLLTGHPDDRMKTLQEMSSALGLSASVHFAGHLPDEAFQTVWQFAAALVFPSLHEGFGIPLVEAFQAKLPVLAADASVLPEVGGDACHWFDPRSPQSLALAMAKITDDPVRRQQLAEAGTKRLARFSQHYEASRLNHFLHAAARHLVP